MSDLAVWNVHGPVETLRIELAMWDRDKQEWQPAQPPTLIRFRPDGQTSVVESRSADGSVSRMTSTYNDGGKIAEIRTQTADAPVAKTINSYDSSGRLVRTVTVEENGTTNESEICRYDAGGRKTSVRFLPKAEGNLAYSMEMEGGAAFLGVKEAVTMTTAYDEHGQPGEILIHNTSHVLLRRMAFTRDSQGRLVKEEVFAAIPFPGIEAHFKDAPPETQAAITTALATIFAPDKPMSTTTYTYDQKGRQVERVIRMGALSEDRTIFRFDDHDNPIEEIGEHASRDMRMDEHGNPQTSGENSYRQHTRYIYKYDADGNWTEREVSSTSGSDKDFQSSNIERRRITYYPSGPR